MKIGVCGNLKCAEYARAVGFDFMEEFFFVVAGMSIEEFSAYARGYEKLDIPVYAFNCFFSGKIPLYAEDSLSLLRPYIKKGFERASALGARYIAIGSGKPRSIPAGFGMERGKQRFLDILLLCSELADQYKLTVLIEPLNKNETNLINTVAEGGEMARRSGKTNIGTLVDFYHFHTNGEPDNGLDSSKDVLYHAHFCCPYNRNVPGPEDIPIVKHWAKLLKRVGFKGAVSIECDLEEDCEKKLIAAKEMAELFRIKKTQLSFSE